MHNDEGLAHTTFVEDSDVMPSTSYHSSQPTLSLGDADAGFDSVLNDVFASGSRIFQPLQIPNFLEEVYEEKPPKIIGDYLFGNVVGEGSYSKVKEVLHKQKLIRRAVKIIKDKRLRKIPGGEANVQREIEILKRVRHPNVVQLCEVFRVEEKQKLYIIMEFCVCSMQQMLDNCPQKRLPEFQAHLYFSQLMSGLEYLHTQGIIHKDIKPGNLLLSLDGMLKICDMGVAEELESGDANSDWCSIAQGTPKFQPPEIVQGTNTQFRGRPCDIWAAGVTLYHMVSSQYPFEGDVVMKLFDNIVKMPLEMPTTVTVSDDLEKLLCGLLEKDPELRWNSTLIMSSSWMKAEHVVVGEQVVSVPEMKNAPAHRPMSVYRALEQLYETDEEGETVGEQPENACLPNIPSRYSIVAKRTLAQPASIQAALSRGVLDSEIRPAATIVNATHATEEVDIQPDTSVDFDDDSAPLTADANGNGKPAARPRRNFFARCFAACGSSSP
ncbi:CAMK/CAMKL/LKB protein kinase [Aphelenchoides avenae]|nr:CAMK/CAMKL/LKB protein kinase [Aphelenchus avenae]